MSYSRWIDSKWYAFWRSSDAEDIDSQTLALWHCHEEQNPNWSYADTHNVDRSWLRSRYPGASDDDISEAIGIIYFFRMEVEQRDRQRRFKRLTDTVKRDPHPQNVDVLIDMFIDDSEDTPSTGELLDFLFSLPAFVWEPLFLGKLASVDVESVYKKEDHYLQLLDGIGSFKDKDRLLAIVRTWADKLSRRIATGQAPPASAPTSPERILLHEIFGRPSSPEKILEEIHDALSKFSSGNDPEA